MSLISPKTEKKRVCFLNTLYDRVEAQAQWIYFCNIELCIMIHMFVARIILRHCEKLISFEMEYKKDFQISNLKPSPLESLETQLRTKFNINIHNFNFDLFQWGPVFCFIFGSFHSSYSTLWLNISSFIWLNVKLNTAFATVVFTVTVKSKKNTSLLRSLSSKLPCSSVSINTLESN